MSETPVAKRLREIATFVGMEGERIGMTRADHVDLMGAADDIDDLTAERDRLVGERDQLIRANAECAEKIAAQRHEIDDLTERVADLSGHV